MTNKTASSRPWQGTLLAILNIIGLVMLGLLMAALLMISAGGSMMSQFAEGAVPAFFGTIGLFFLVPLAAIFVLGIFVTKGLFSGQRWTVILMMVFTVLGLLSAFGSLRYSIAPLAINALMLWAEVMCYKHPFYK